MKPDPKEKHKQHSFDAYCKRILKNESSDYHRRMNVLRQYEIPFSMLPQGTLAQMEMKTTLAALLPIDIFIFVSGGLCIRALMIIF